MDIINYFYCLCQSHCLAAVSLGLGTTYICLSSVFFFFFFLAHLFVQRRSLPLVTELKNSVPLIVRLLLVLLIHTLAILLGKPLFLFFILFCASSVLMYLSVSISVKC